MLGVEQGLRAEPQGPRSPRLEEVARAAVLDEVQGPAGGRRDDGQPGGRRLLERLAERLTGARVDEGVERGIRPGEVVALSQAEEGRAGQEALELGPGRAVTDEDEPGAGQVRDLDESVQLLLRGQPPHVAEQGLAVGGEGPADGAAACVVAPAGMEERGVDAATPAPDPRYAVAQEVVRGGGRGREGEVGEGVDAADPPPGTGFGGAPGQAAAVLAQVARHVGLVDGDRREAEAVGRDEAARPEDEGGRDVDDVRREPGEDRLDLARGKPDMELTDGEGPCRVHGIPAVGRGGGGGRDDERLVALGAQVVRDAAHAGGHAVGARQERLRDDGDPHGVHGPQRGCPADDAPGCVR